MTKAPVRDDWRHVEIDIAVRWCGNILNELIGNHSRFLTTPQRNALKQAVQALADYQFARQLAQDEKTKP